MKFFLCACVLWFFTTSVVAQEALSPVDSGVRIPLEREVQQPRTETETIIVIGRRLERDFPQPYASYVYTDPSTFTHDTTMGEDRYIYIRPMLSVSEQTTVEYYSTWTGNSLDGYRGMPTHNGRSGRVVCRKESIFQFLFPSEWLRCLQD